VGAGVDSPVCEHRSGNRNLCADYRDAQSGCELLWPEAGKVATTFAKELWNMKNEVVLSRVPLEAAYGTGTRAALMEAARAIFAPQTISRYSGELESKKLVSSLPLRDALLKLAIDPLDPVKVEQYKQSKVMSKKVMMPGWKMFWLVWSIAVVAAVVTASFGSEKVWQLWAGAGVTGIACFIALVGACDKGTTFLEVITRWESDNVGAHNFAQMPDFALERFLKVREACPTARFIIESLHEDRTIRNPTEDAREAERLRRRAADPFLVAELGAERFYLDVWDEPQFERTI
jgi:hypothetical protein